MNTVKLNRGTPQGGVLSPAIWNFNFDRVLELYDSTPVLATGFADDLSLLISGVDLETMTDIAQGAVDRAVAWGKTCGLKFGPAKTVVVLFTHRRVSLGEARKLQIEGTSIPFSSCLLYTSDAADE